MANYIAIDLGASSGRVMLGRVEVGTNGPSIGLEELHRFPNGPVRIHGHLYWDVLRIWDEILRGLTRYTSTYREPIAGIGIDTWAVDYGLLDGEGQLLGNPFNYRDSRTDGMLERVEGLIAPQRLYQRTGIQRLPLNTIYQLASMKRDGATLLGSAESLLLMPDLFHYWLTGRIVSEYTNATTTQLIDVATGEWAADLIKALGLPTGIFPQLVQPGTHLGTLLPEVRDTIGLAAGHEAPVVAVATHDTASAVAAIPGLGDGSAYISSGTWSLVGIELREPIVTERARLLNFTNEGGVGGTIRFLRNVAGFWLLQECQRCWSRDGTPYTWTELESMACEAQPMRSLIDPDAPDFLNPSDMRVAIQRFCQLTGQTVPETEGEIARCCIDSLALRYRWVIEALQQVAGRHIETVRVVGGGSQHRMLCQLTADVSNRRVVAGPVEATALGNVMVQAIASGKFADIESGRRAIESSVQPDLYEPEPSMAYEKAYDRFLTLVSMTSAQ
jgi:rhamnulokinase